MYVIVLYYISVSCLFCYCGSVLLWNIFNFWLLFQLKKPEEAMENGKSVNDVGNSAVDVHVEIGGNRNGGQCLIICFGSISVHVCSFSKYSLCVLFMDLQ
jgi:hypothetical protein